MGLEPLVIIPVINNNYLFPSHAGLLILISWFFNYHVYLL